jgi:hypothetical protein
MRRNGGGGSRGGEEDGEGRVAWRMFCPLYFSNGVADSGNKKVAG